MGLLKKAGIDRFINVTFPFWWAFDKSLKGFPFVSYTSKGVPDSDRHYEALSISSASWDARRTD